MEHLQAIPRGARIVMRGSFEEFGLPSILQSASLTRQLTRVDVSDRSSRPLGSILLKGGQVVAAVAGDSTAVPALRKLLGADKDCRFTMSRLGQTLEPVEPLGSIELLLRKAQMPEIQVRERRPVMRGSLQQVGLRELCAALSMSRRPLEIEALSESGEVLARLAIKSGLVVAADSGGQTGRAALQRFPRVQATSFAVYHSELANDVEVLCSIADLFLPTDTITIVRDRSRSERPVPPPVPTARRNHSSVPAQAEPRTPVISVLSAKGGSGKTTIALNLSVALAQRGLKVVLLDLDVQGGTLAALDAVGKYAQGFYDVVANRIDLQRAIVPTNLSALRLLPTGKVMAGDPELQPQTLARVLSPLREAADLVIIDTPSGLSGVTRTAAELSTHLLAVVQAEPLSARSLHLLPSLIRELGPRSPALLGIVVNMLDYRNRASVATLDTICTQAGAEWVFDVPFARTQAFLEASELGVPLGLANKSSSPSAAWLFEGLATSVLERLALLTPRVPAARLL
jgi:chromosome partitioning protein